MSYVATRLGRHAATATAFAAAAIVAVSAIGFSRPAAAGDVSYGPVITGPNGTNPNGTAVTGVRLFGADEAASAAIFAFPKWTGMLARYQREQALETLPCTGGDCALQAWAKFVAGLQGQSPMAQLEAVNAYVNRTPYQPDDSRYGVADYWATPRQFLGRSGDCEDYAIAKYLSLRKLGWSADRLRIVVLMHQRRRELHAVLVAYVDGTAYVLDNLMEGVVDQRQIAYYRPIYSINEHAWYRHFNWSPARNQYSAAQPGGAGQVLAAPPARSYAPPHATYMRAAYMRAAYAPRRLSPAARSYAGNASESTASLFAGPNAIR